jgi:hypothetical protein
VAASGRYIRYERGLRYSRQRIRAIKQAWCACGRPGVALADAGSGLVGWRHLAPACDQCVAGRPTLTLREFVARLDGRVRIDEGPDGMAHLPGMAAPTEVTADAEQPFAVLTAEIALLHARLDNLQARLDG